MKSELFCINMQRIIADVHHIRRRYRSVFPLSRIGFLFPCYSQENTTFTNKLELCLRISSSSSTAYDVIDGQEFHTPFPHVILKLPGSAHTYAIKTEREAVYLQYPSELLNAMREAGLLNTPRIWQVSITREIREILFRLRRLLYHVLEPGVIDRIDLTAMELFELLIEQDSQHNRISNEMKEKITEIASFFLLNFMNDIDLERLLRENGLSRRSFFRYWKKFHQIGPAEYIRDLRLRHAATLLVETSFDVAEIARMVKLGNSSYLSKLFRNHFGATPLQYRHRPIKSL